MRLTEYDDPDLETPELETIELGSVSDAPPSAPAGRGALTGLIVALVVVSLVVGFGTATLVLNARDSGSDAVAFEPSPTTIPASGGTGTTTPGTTAPKAPPDPNESVLAGLIVHQPEIPASATVHHTNHGADLTISTLDLCNGTYPSEKDRTARRQVVVTDANGDVRFSTEAVLYRSPAFTAQAFRELVAVAKACPATPVVSPVGEGIAITKFRAAPDGAWPKVASVDRLAFDFTSVDASTGTSTRSVAVYLRRGRALLGVYFATPDGAQLPVAGHTTVASIVNVFETRLAAVPAASLGA